MVWHTRYDIYKVLSALMSAALGIHFREGITDPKTHQETIIELQLRPYGNMLVLDIGLLLWTTLPHRDVLPTRILNGVHNKHSGASYMLRCHLHGFNINTNLLFRSAQPRDPETWEWHVGCRVTCMASVSMWFSVSVVFIRRCGCVVVLW